MQCLAPFVLALVLTTQLAGCSDGDARDLADASDGDAGAGDAAVRDPYPHACTYTRDLDADGDDDWAVTYELDDEGRVTRDETDADGDGALDFINVTTYDDEGRQLTRELDEDADGELDVEYTTEYRDDGQPERNVDYDAEGEVISMTDFVYDEDGFLIEMLGVLPATSAHDHGDGAGHASLMTFENDDNGCVIATARDDHQDGVIELSTSREVDEDCNPREIAADDLDDGEVDRVWTTTYDDAGRVLIEKFIERGVMRIRRETTWQGDLKVREVEQRGADTTVKAYAYDDAGNLIRVEADAHDDGVGVETTKYEIDGRGNVLRVTIDDRGDGVTDDISAYTYGCWE